MEVKHLKTSTKELSPISSSDKELYKQFPLVNDLNQINKNCIRADLQLGKKYLPKIIHKKFFCNVKSENLYSISYKNN